MKRIIIETETGQEINTEALALRLYQDGSPIVYCDIEAIVAIDGIGYILDECGHWDYIPNGYEVKEVEA